MKIERRDQGPGGNRFWSVETELDRWIGRILWLLAVVIALILLRVAGVDPMYLMKL
jgi:hypothetical protein